MKPRVLIISLRKLGHAPIGYGAMFEFEESIQRFEDADRVEIVSDQTSWQVALPHRINTAVRVLTGGRFGNTGPMPWPADVRLEQDYDLAFFIADGIFHMRLANLVRDVRKRCRTMALFVQESWPSDYEDRRIHTQPYRLFDHYFFDLNASEGQFEAHAHKPALDLAVACDTLRFAPRHAWADRAYDVAWVGRRDPVVHERIRAMCERRNWRYYYDPFDSGWSNDLTNQRRWLAELLGDSRFAISNFARSNQPEVHRGRRHLASRFAESIAAGSVLVGALPDAKALADFMPWPDAAFEGGSTPDLTIEALVNDPVRMTASSRRNVANALRHHDWAHRWGQVLDTVGLPRGERLQDYLATLDARATDFDDQPDATANPAQTVPLATIVGASAAVVGSVPPSADKSVDPAVQPAPPLGAVHV